MLLWDQLKHHATIRGDKRALVCGDAVVTFAELSSRAEALGRAWLEAGLQPGDRVALHMGNGIDLATCYYAAFAAGFVAVPINTRLTAPEIAYILENCGARGYVAQPDLKIETAVPMLGLQSGEVRHDVSLPQRPADDTALILYTSGTTARPKGVRHTHGTLEGNVSYMVSWGVTDRDHTLLFTSMAHASGAIMLFMSSVSIGATVTIVPAFDPSLVLDTWERSGATFFMGLPTLIRAMLIEQRARPRRIVTGRLTIAGGDTVPVAMQAEYVAAFRHPIVEGFGMTEGLPVLANHPDRNRLGSLGRPLGDIEVRVVEGEMWLRGSGIAAGYWGGAAFEDGWLKTGDLAEIDAEGFVWFRGRKKELIIRGGANISPQEVEAALYRHPAVAEAGVIGAADEYWGEVVLAYVALRQGHSTTADELAAFARQSLAEYKCPARIEFLKALPKGATGKVQRRGLRELLASASASA